MSTLTRSALPRAAARPAAAAAPSWSARVAAFLRETVSAVGASRAALAELAREHDASRPALAARLRSAARGGWL